MNTKTINVRHVPVDLARQAKAEAASRGVTLTDFVIEAIRVAVREASKKKAIR